MPKSLATNQSLLLSSRSPSANSIGSDSMSSSSSSSNSSSPSNGSSNSDSQSFFHSCVDAPEFIPSKNNRQRSATSRRSRSRRRRTLRQLPRSLATGNKKGTHGPLSESKKNTSKATPSRQMALTSSASDASPFSGMSISSSSSSSTITRKNRSDEKKKKKEKENSKRHKSEGSRETTTVTSKRRPQLRRVDAKQHRVKRHHKNLESSTKSTRRHRHRHRRHRHARRHHVHPPPPSNSPTEKHKPKLTMDRIEHFGFPTEDLGLDPSFEQSMWNPTKKITFSQWNWHLDTCALYGLSQ